MASISSLSVKRGNSDLAPVNIVTSLLEGVAFVDIEKDPNFSITPRLGLSLAKASFALQDIRGLCYSMTKLFGDLPIISQFCPFYTARGTFPSMNDIESAGAQLSFGPVAILSLADLALIKLMRHVTCDNFSKSNDQKDLLIKGHNICGETGWSYDHKKDSIRKSLSVISVTDSKSGTTLTHSWDLVFTTVGNKVFPALVFSETNNKLDDVPFDLFGWFWFIDITIKQFVAGIVSGIFRFDSLIEHNSGKTWSKLRNQVYARPERKLTACIIDCLESYDNEKDFGHGQSLKKIWYSNRSIETVTLTHPDKRVTVNLEIVPDFILSTMFAFEGGCTFEQAQRLYRCCGSSGTKKVSKAVLIGLLREYFKFSWYSCILESICYDPVTGFIVDLPGHMEDVVGNPGVWFYHNNCLYTFDPEKVRVFVTHALYIPERWLTASKTVWTTFQTCTSLREHVERTARSYLFHTKNAHLLPATHNSMDCKWVNPPRFYFRSEPADVVEAMHRSLHGKIFYTDLFLREHTLFGIFGVFPAIQGKIGAFMNRRDAEMLCRFLKSHDRPVIPEKVQKKIGKEPMLTIFAMTLAMYDIFKALFYVVQNDLALRSYLKCQGATEKVFWHTVVSMCVKLYKEECISTDVYYGIKLLDHLQHWRAKEVQKFGGDPIICSNKVWSDFVVDYGAHFINMNKYYPVFSKEAAQIRSLRQWRELARKRILDPDNYERLRWKENIFISDEYLVSKPWWKRVSNLDIVYNNLDDLDHTDYPTMGMPEDYWDNPEYLIKVQDE